jgi:putative phosphoesterase
MKIAIVSDTHDNLANFNRVIDWCNNQGIKTMLHCGDICTQATINEAEQKFSGIISFAKGNGDYDLDNYQDMIDTELDGKKIACIHYPNLARELAESGKYDIVFYGHTHKPWEERVGNCRLVNPGELAGHRFKPTFAIYDTQTDALELKILEKL